MGSSTINEQPLNGSARGLDAKGMGTSVGASSMTLGGMMNTWPSSKSRWFSEKLRGRATSAPWDVIDWEKDPDWEWRTARNDAPDELRDLWRRSVEEANAMIDEALSEGGVDQLAIKKWPDGRAPSLRWILCHMIEEYARHNGHADLIREAVDGQTGE